MSKKLEEILQQENFQKAFSALQKKNWDFAQDSFKNILEEANSKNDVPLQSLAYSCLGLVAQLKKDWKESWRQYEKAEKLDPQNAYYKLLVARLLLRLFGQNETAIRKCEKIIMQEGVVPALRHQAYITIGLAYLKKSDRKRATKSLLQSIGESFSGLTQIADLDFSLLEALAHKNIAAEECRYFIEEAKTLALALKEKKAVERLDQMLQAFPY